MARGIKNKTHKPVLELEDKILQEALQINPKMVAGIPLHPVTKLPFFLTPGPHIAASALVPELNTDGTLRPDWIAKFKPEGSA